MDKGASSGGTVATVDNASTLVSQSHTNVPSLSTLTKVGSNIVRSTSEAVLTANQWWYHGATTVTINNEIKNK